MTQLRAWVSVLWRIGRPPLADRRFWVVQLLTVLMTLAIAVLWSRWLAGLPSHLGQPVADAANLLFLVPVIYAALNFGLSGSVATALLVALVRGAYLIVWHDPLQLWILGAVYATVLAVAVFVGGRVEREVEARRDAEAAHCAARASEAQFRRLFESSPAPTLLLAADSTVRRANPAAAALFGRSRPELEGVSLATVVGEKAAAAIAGGREQVLEHRHGSREPSRFLRPVVSRDGTSEGPLQVVFVDVSEERRQLGISDAYAAFVLRAQEEERSRIAQEVHDEPLQRVVQLCHQLDRAAAGAGGLGPSLAAARRTAEDIGKELRRLAGGLRPPALDELGLAATLRIVARDLRERVPDLDVQVLVSGRQRRLDPMIELNLFRIAQEALRNVERHAEASEVAVTLAYGRQGVRLSIVDDGRGLPGDGADGALPAGRLGLVGMRERARLLGGQLETDSGPGAGTRIEVSIQTA
jgi:PAS domain S-box-containing protein